MVTTFTSIGQLLGSAVVGAVAASLPGAAGFEAAFSLLGALGVVLLVLALGLKSHGQEAPREAREASHA
jgi:Kef-type K+ transport system membrane component KefB